MMFKPDVTDEEADGLINKYAKFINDDKGVFEGAEKWGKRDIMAPLFKFRKLREAYYVKLIFTKETGDLIKLSYAINIDNSVLRHLITKVKKSRKMDAKAVAK